MGYDFNADEIFEMAHIKLFRKELVASQPVL